MFDEDYLVILPTVEIPGLKEWYASCAKVKGDEYSSAHSLMNKDEIRAMLEKGGFLL
ncbi:hypothetical protein LJK88_11675 [Paenibacillus sp. P26]|nr:hypothetical protein LJK88_11675 [Paenibacillus sp. P26]UUZ89562.1 hypothetical protein LJK87_26010 [Paenibacillus sp. P25]